METNSGAIISSNLIDSFGEMSSLLSDCALRVGQIVDVLYIDDVRNLSEKTAVEYNVLVNEDNQSKMLYKNCRSIDGFGDTVNFKETILTPSVSKLDKTGTPELKDQYIYKNGAIVILGLINNLKDSGVILAGIQHTFINTTKPSINVTEFSGSGSSISRDDALKELPTLSPGAQSASKGLNQGQRILGEFNGIRWNINQDGEFTVIFQGVKDDSGNIKDLDKQPTVLKINKDGEFFIIDNLDQEIKISRKDEAIIISDGQIDPNIITIDRKNDHITVKSTKTVQLIAPEVDISANTSIVTGEIVKLGGKGAKQQLVLGNDFMILFNAFVTAYLGHSHLGAGIMTTATVNKMTNSQHLSQNVTVDSNFSGKPRMRLKI